MFPLDKLLIKCFSMYHVKLCFSTCILYCFSFRSDPSFSLFLPSSLPDLLDSICYLSVEFLLGLTMGVAC